MPFFKVMGEKIRFCNKHSISKSRVITGKRKSWRTNKAIIQNQMACVSFPLPQPLPAPGSPPPREEGDGALFSPGQLPHLLACVCVSSHSLPCWEAETGGGRGLGFVFSSARVCAPACAQSWQCRRPAWGRGFFTDLLQALGVVCSDVVRLGLVLQNV